LASIRPPKSDRYTATPTEADHGDINNLILEHLRAIRTDLAGLKEDLREIKSRMASLESGIANLRRDNTHSQATER
jgi:hypothetical protein